VANVNAPFGFRSIGRTLEGGEIELVPFNVLSSYATTIFIGDVVEQNAAGNIDRVITPGTTVMSGVSMNHGILSTTRVQLVCAQARALFAAQALLSLVYADTGLNVNVQLGTGSTTTKKSADVLDTETENTTASLDFKLLRKRDEPNNDFGNYSRWEVVFNVHRMNGSIAGV
jgi:hypothetical protein